MTFDSVEPSEVQRVAFDMAPDAILVVDEHGALVGANVAARDLAARDALLTAFRREPQWTAFRLEVRARGRATMDARIGDGWLQVDGRTCGARTLLFVRDVTAARDLENDVARLWSVASTGALASSLVHDFNNLLTPMVTLCEVLVRELSEHRSGEIVEELRETVDRAVALVDAVRGSLRGEAAKREQLWVNDVVGELRPLVERIVGSGVEVTFSLGSETGAVVVDRVRLERSLLNLIANARDAMEGQGRLVVHTFAVLHDGVPHAAIGVRDDGCGMPAALRARAFEPLFTTKAGKGSGLGLWLVHRFARDAGGSVEIRGDVADGTEVVVYLPRVTARTTRHGSGAFFERGTGADGNEEAKSACAR